jgi:hypothetical protein
LAVEASQLCDNIKTLSEGLTAEEIFLLIIDNIEFLIKTKQYVYAGMLACIAVKFLEDNLCQPCAYLKYSLFSNMRSLFRDNPLVYYQYGLKLLDLLESLKENPALKTYAIKQFNCFLIDMMVVLAYHPDSFNEENILALAQKVGENITALITEKHENIDIDYGMVINLIANFSSRLFATGNTAAINSFIKNIQEIHLNDPISILLFYSILSTFQNWLFIKTEIAQKSQELIQTSLLILKFF